MHYEFSLVSFGRPSISLGDGLEITRLFRFKPQILVLSVEVGRRTISYFINGHLRTTLPSTPPSRSRYSGIRNSCLPPSFDIYQRGHRC